MNKDVKYCSNKNCKYAEPQPLSNFYKDKKSKDGFTQKCKSCKSEINNNYRLSNKRTKENIKQVSLMSKYGITLEIFEQMLMNQNYRCLICDRHQSEFKRALCVDHCHETGQVRGLLCISCNHDIGHYEKFLKKNLIPKFDNYLDR